MKLDPNDYGDLERFMSVSQSLSHWHDRLVNFACDEHASIEDGEKLLAGVESYDLLQQTEACEAFFDAYTGEPDEREAIPKQVIAQHIGNLIDCYPSSRIQNIRVYVETIVEEVYRKRTSRVVIELACRELKRTMKTPPALASILEVLDKHHDKWAKINFWGFSDLVDEARDKVRDLNANPRPAAAVADGHSRPTGPVSAEDIRTPSMVAPGERVRHEKFGLGTVEAVDGNKLTVEFDTAGRKMVLDTFVEQVGELTP